MSSLHQTVQRGRVSSHQDGEQKTGEGSGLGSVSRLERSGSIPVGDKFPSRKVLSVFED